MDQLNHVTRFLAYRHLCFCSHISMHNEIPSCKFVKLNKIHLYEIHFTQFHKFATWYLIVHGNRVTQTGMSIWQESSHVVWSVHDKFENKFFFRRTPKVSRVGVLLRAER